MLLLIKNSMRKNVTEYLDITEGLYSEKIAVEDANGCITFGEMKRNALKIAEFCVEQNIFKQPVCVYLPKSKEMVTSLLVLTIVEISMSHWILNRQTLVYGIYWLRLTLD